MVRCLCVCFYEKPIHITGSYWFIVDKQKLTHEESLLMHPVVNLCCRNSNRLKEQQTTLEKSGSMNCVKCQSFPAAPQHRNAEAFFKTALASFSVSNTKKKHFTKHKAILMFPVMD